MGYWEAPFAARLPNLDFTIRDMISPHAFHKSRGRVMVYSTPLRYFTAFPMASRPEAGGSLKAGGHRTELQPGRHSGGDGKRLVRAAADTNVERLRRRKPIAAEVVKNEPAGSSGEHRVRGYD